MKKCRFCKLLKRLIGVAVFLYGLLFVVFYFELDGKALFYGVEPFLTRHYESMERKDMTKTQYDVDKYPKYEYNK